MSRTLASLSRLERKWLGRRTCGFCDISALSPVCGAHSGLYTLPIIEGVRDQEEVVDLGPPCNMDEGRARALQDYRPRIKPIPKVTTKPRELDPEAWGFASKAEMDAAFDIIDNELPEGRGETK